MPSSLGLLTKSRDDLSFFFIYLEVSTLDDLAGFQSHENEQNMRHCQSSFDDCQN